MKNILVATDFSATAKHAAEYAYQLASDVKANLTLCNAFIVPAEMPGAGVILWPLYEYDELEKDGTDELQKLKAQLEDTADKTAFKPSMECVDRAGTVAAVIDEIVEKEKSSLIVMGTHGSSGLSEFIIGNHSRIMIDNTLRPLLLVPPSAKISKVKKIAFATDFKEYDKDLKAIYELIEFIKPLNAELLITHIHTEKPHTPDFKDWLDNFLVEISNKANYPNIYYRVIESNKAEKGLDWLCEHGHVDMLAMVHHKHSFLDGLINGSHTKKMAGHITVPLLVLPENV